jgi:DNA-binding CsgD family transcriptional regulator
MDERDRRAAVLSAVRRIRNDDLGDMPDRSLDEILVRLDRAPLVPEDQLEATRPPVIKGLSHRERQVLEGASHGLLNQQIAELFGIRPDTVKTHMKRICAKLAAKNRAHAVAIGLRERMIR